MTSRRLIISLIGLLLLLPATALAQEDPCYVNPTLPECRGVVVDDVVVDDVVVDDVVVDDVVVDDVVVEDVVVEDEAEELDVTVVSDVEALPTTGADTSVLVLAAVGLVGLGALLLLLARRRKSVSGTA
jgi:LPXTG-motif cell wall-anchored protein